MSLTPDQTAALLRHIQKKWKSSSCTQCGVNHWSSDGIVNLPISDGPNVTLAGAALPCGVVICNNCGYTVLVNLVVAGVVKP